jgi:hypothetical protein
VTVPHQATAEHWAPSVLGVVALVCGYASQLWIEALGQLYWAEVILPAVALAVALTRWPAELFRNSRLLMVCLLLMLIGFIASDLSAGTSSDNFLRGWSRVVVLATDSIALMIIYERNRWALWWFWLGAAAFGLQAALLAGIPITQWKFGYAEPVTTGAMNLSAFMPGWMSAGAYLFLGAVSILFDYRSLGAVLLVAGAILFMSGSASRRLAGAARMRSMVLVVGGVAAAAAIVVFLLSNSQSEFAQRRGASDIGRFSGLKVAMIAVADSPILGYGSWGEGTGEYADLFQKEALGDMMRIGAENMMESGDGFLPHSQILQAWMEGGILAAVFFMVYGWYLAMTVRDLAFAKAATRFRGFLLAMLLLNLWHLMMSPFMGSHRLNIASAIAIVVCSALGRQGERQRAFEPQCVALQAPPNLMR